MQSSADLDLDLPLAHSSLASGETGEDDAVGAGGATEGCVCGRDAEASPEAAVMIQCDICFSWHHVSCVGLRPEEVEAIGKYHCPRCETLCGPSTIKQQVTTSSSSSGAASGRKRRLTPAGRRYPSALAPRPDELRVRPPHLDRVVTRASAEDFDDDVLDSSGFSRPVLLTSAGDDEDDSERGATVEERCSRRLETLLALEEPVPCFLRGEEDEEDPADTPALLESFRACEPDLAFKLDPVPATALAEVAAPYLVRRLAWDDHRAAARSAAAAAAAKNKKKKRKLQAALPPPAAVTHGRSHRFCHFLTPGSFEDFNLGHCGLSTWFRPLESSPSGCSFFVVGPSVANLVAFRQWSKEGRGRHTFSSQVPGECFQVDLSPGETLILPAGWMHGIRCMEESPAVLVGGHFRHSLDIKVQFRLIQQEDRADPESLRQYWLSAPRLRHEFSGFSGRPRMQARLVSDGMQELLSNLQIWPEETRPTPDKDGVRPDKVLRELAKDVKKCERALVRSEEEEEDTNFSSSVKGDEEQVASPPLPPPATLKSGGLKLTISTAFASPPFASSHHQSPPAAVPPESADLTDRDSVKKLMSSASSATASSLLSVPLLSSSLFSGFSPGPAAAPQRPPPNPLTSISSKKKKKSKKSGGKKSSAASELDKELGSALMGFGMDPDQEDDHPEDDGGGDFEIDLSRRNKSSSAVAERRVRREEEDRAAMKEVYRDEQFVYPSLLGQSDEEGEGGASSRSKKSSRRDRDSNYSPKVTLGSVGPRRDRAQLRRDHARVAGVERGLQAAREEEGQAQGEARKKRKDKKKKSSTKKVPKKKSLLSPTTSTPPIAAASTALSKTSSSLTKDSRPNKPKKGGSTVKQRLGKILKLKFH